ncbi:MAG: 2-oxoglutarate/2-oxoacid ferredoxin oxidoreductase subunit alpha, partial [Mycobacterium sp.]|nr:2-oxoglutarate/2-oxoacid ferredoxin oxidoreductase subunit alpha [Mycobacterium sp.]
FGETAELFDHPYSVKPAMLTPGTYTSINGNTALAWGLVAASQLAKLPMFLGSYPITPASDILHELSKHKNFGVRTLQAEDESGGICAALGAAYGGALGVTSTSGPGLSLKSEALGLGVMTELPLIVIDVQRGGPSTGLPTKTEQADLLQALYGRNGESPVAVLAPRSPSDCFETALEAVRIAVSYHTPVILLSDGAIANGSEPWRIPDVDALEPIQHTFAKPDEPFQPYARDPETLARLFAVPGTPGLEHRIGGLESANGSGDISYEPANHDLMVRLRQAKIDGISVPELEVDDPTGDAELLLIGWGSSYGPIGEACRRARRNGIKVAHAHLRYLRPFPANLGEVLRRYPQVVCPEMNLGQLALLLRGKYLVDVQSVTKVQGVSFLADEVGRVIRAALGGTLAEIEQDKTMVARLAAATVGAGANA